MRPLKAGAVYFLIAFAAGWIMGPIRELLLIPNFGRSAGYLIEALLMLLVVVLAALWTTRRFDVPAAAAPRVAMGLTGLVLLLVAELLGSWWVRGLRPLDYVASFDLFSGLISLLLYAALAVMPVFLRPRPQ